jgi:hypothetical protein
MDGIYAAPKTQARPTGKWTACKANKASGNEREMETKIERKIEGKIENRIENRIENKKGRR